MAEERGTVSSYLNVFGYTTVLYRLFCKGDSRTIYAGKVVVVVLLFYVHGKDLRSCRDGQLT